MPRPGATANGSAATFDSRGRTLPSPFGSARALAHALAETIAGNRPVQQLADWMDLETYQKMQRRIRWERATAEAMEPGAASTRQPRVRVLGTHAQVVAVGACECTCTFIGADDHARAIAFRLEFIRSRWRAVALEIG